MAEESTVSSVGIFRSASHDGGTVHTTSKDGVIGQGIESNFSCIVDAHTEHGCITTDTAMAAGSLSAAATESAVGKSSIGDLDRTCKVNSLCTPVVSGDCLP